MSLSSKLIDAIYREQHLLTQLSPVDRSVLHALAHHMNDATGHCQPSNATLARDTGFSRNTVAQSLKTLQRVGFIDWSERRIPVSEGSKLFTIRHALDPDDPEQVSLKPIRESQQPQPSRMTAVSRTLSRRGKRPAQ
jgi:DNA-binding transcriptional MocR family regulator